MNKKFLRMALAGLLACPIFLSDSAFSYSIDGGSGTYATGVGNAIPRDALNKIARDVSSKCGAPGDKGCTPYLQFRGEKKEVGPMQGACSQMHDLSSSATREKNLRVQCSATGADKRGKQYSVGCKCNRIP